MNNRRLLYLSAHQMTAYLWQSGTLVNEAVFAATELGHQQFADYLASQSRSVFSILVNVSEEGFHIETIPYLQGADRSAVIARKLVQYFFNAGLTASLSLGYSKSKRKDERVMLAALSNNEFFAPWLKAIGHSGAALSGIYSLPLTAPALLRKLNINEEHCLLLSVQDQSIRQNYFDKGELHFSRLTPLHNSSIGGIAQTLSSESLKLQQYLSSQRLIGRNQAISVHILAHPVAFKAIQASCTNTATMHYNILDLEECARKTGLLTALPDSHCELLFLHLLATSPPRIQFANDDLRHGHHLKQISTGLHALGAVALLGCLLFSGKLMFDTYTIRQETSAFRNEAGIYQQRYNDITKTFPTIPTSNETLRRIIDRYLELQRKSATPVGLYREISRALQAVPAADLDSINWNVGGADSGPASASPQASVATAVPRDSEAIVVHGTLKPGANASARQILGAFNQLVDALQANPKLQVDVLKRPFDIESGKSLKGGDITLEDSKPRSFSLQVMRKIEL